jgi:hypothetical protein
MRAAMHGARPLFDAVFERPLVVELGIVDGAKLQSEWRQYVESGEGMGLYLFQVLQAELWLRTHRDAGATASTPVEDAPVTVP